MRALGGSPPTSFYQLSGPIPLQYLSLLEWIVPEGCPVTSEFQVSTPMLAGKRVPMQSYYGVHEWVLPERWAYTPL